MKLKRLALLFVSSAALLLQAATPGELIDQLVASLNETSQGLEAIKDVAGAKASVDKLTISAGRVTALKTELSKLKLETNNAEAMALLQQKGAQIQQASQRMHNALVQARGLPGVRRELRPVFRQLRESRPEDEDQPKQQ